MNRPWLAYLIVALVACGAGVAIAGLPSSDSSPLLAPVTPITTAAPADTVTVTGAPATSAPPSTTTSAPATSTTTSTTSSTTSSTVASTTTTTTLPSTTTSTTTAASSTTTTPTSSPPVLPSEAAVAVANGAGVPGIAGDAAALLIEAGFVDVVAVDSVAVDVTTVYYADGFESIAALVATELFIDPDAKAAMSELPDLETDREFDVVAVLGADVDP